MRQCLSVWFSLIFVLLSLVSFTQEEKESKKDKTEKTSKKNDEIDQKKILIKAREYYRARDFTDAFKLYSELHKMDTANPTYNYELGATIFEGSFNKAASKKYFEKAEKNGDRKEMPELFYYLGRVYHLEHNFLFATAAYSTYKAESLPKGKAGKKRRKEIDAYINQCEEGRDLLEKDNTILERVDRRSQNIAKFYIEGNKYVQLENMGDEINSKFSEYGPIILNEGKNMVFTSRRTGSTGGELYSDGQYFEDIYIAANKAGYWMDVNNVNNSPFFNGALVNHNGHNATVSISPNEDQLFFYTENHVDVIRFDGAQWLEPEKFSSKFNKAGTSVTSVTISPDGSKLYVAAERFDCIGGSDLYFSEKMDSAGWSDFVSMGPVINTSLDEDSPYLMDDTTLYFSSKGHSSIGGFDIFVTFLSDTGWTKPKNLEIPINTPFDEVNYMLANDRSHAFYASNRSGGYGEFDLYMITKGIDMDIDPAILAKFEREESGDTSALAENSTLLEGENEGASTSTDGSGAGAGSGIVTGAATESATGKKVLVINNIGTDDKGNLNASTQSQVDNVSNMMLAESAFIVQVMGTGKGDNASEEARQEALLAYNALIAKGIDENRIEVVYTGMGEGGQGEMGSGKNVLAGGAGIGAPMVAKYEETVYFASNSKYVTEYSQNKLAKLIAYTNEHPDAKLYMSGHADHVGNETYNLELSGKRVESVAAYLRSQNVKNPMRKEFFGESKPRLSVSEVSRDPNKLIYNRRVQIVIF